MFQTDGGFGIDNISNSQSIGFGTRTSGGTLVKGFDCRNGNTAFMQGDLNNRITISGATTPTISTQAPINSNDLSIANTAWVNTYYGKLTLASGSTLQSWFGADRFSSNGTNLPIGLQNTDAAASSYGGGMFIVKLME